jgi:hypothetical protein
MNVRFNPAVCLKVAFLVGASALLTGQTTLTSPTSPTATSRQPVGSVGQPDSNSFVRTPFLSPNRIRKDRCDETPRPADCDLKN